MKKKKKERKIEEDINSNKSDVPADPPNYFLARPIRKKGEKERKEEPPEKETKRKERNDESGRRIKGRGSSRFDRQGTPPHMREAAEQISMKEFREREQLRSAEDRWTKSSTQPEKEFDPRVYGRYDDKAKTRKRRESEYAEKCRLIKQFNRPAIDDNQVKNRQKTEFGRPPSKLRFKFSTNSSPSLPRKPVSHHSSGSQDEANSSESTESSETCHVSAESFDRSSPLSSTKSTESSSTTVKYRPPSIRNRTLESPALSNRPFINFEARFSTHSPPQLSKISQSALNRQQSPQKASPQQRRNRRLWQDLLYDSETW